MLVIFDTKNRTSGVKEYLIDGEQINDSKYAGKTGLSEYLNNGKTGDRNIKDMRIPIYGDLDVLDEAIKMGTTKGASESYRNIVLSFEEDEISNKHLKEITDSFIETYMVGYYKSEYTAYAEVHRPKIKYKIDENGKRIKRHLHVHLSIGKYSVKHDRLLDMGHHGEHVKSGGRLKEVEHWKKLTEKRYGLKPSDTNPISQDYSYRDKPLQKTREGLISFCEKKSQDINSLDELINELKQFDFIESIKKSKNARTPYISIKLDNGKSIRLKGSLFSDVTFHKAKEKLLKKEINNIYTESKEPIDVEAPQEFINLQEARFDKVTKDMDKVRSKHTDILSDLISIPLNKEYKDWISKVDYKSEVVSPLSYRVNNIKSKQKNNIDLNFYNQKIDARLLLHILQDSHNINDEIYHAFINKNGQHTIEVGTHKYSITDFLQKEMNFNFDEVIKTLVYVHKEQKNHLNLNIQHQKSNIYQRMSYQNKVFIDIYHSHTNLDLSSFYISKTNDKTILRKQGLTIEDTGDALQSQSSQGLKTQVELMIEIARAKEWDIEDIEIEGTEEFRQEVLKQINEINEQKEEENKETKTKTTRRMK
jgi:hypothetical protein